MLNKYKLNNYAFFCSVSRLHLTVSNPIGYADKVTPAILKALKSKTLIDVDNVIDIETGTVKEAQPIKEPEEHASDKETVNDNKEQEQKATKSSNKRGRKAENTTNDKVAQ